MSYEEVEVIKEAAHCTIKLHGDPISWSAPTFGKKGAYDRKWKRKRDAILLLREKELPKLDGPLMIWVTFCIAMPRSWSRKKRASLLGRHHTNHLDLTNLTKALEDILQNAGLFKDDCFIVAHNTCKQWAEKGLTMVSLFPLT